MAAVPFYPRQKHHQKQQRVYMCSSSSNSNNSNNSKPTANSPQQRASTSTTAPEGTRGELSPGPFGYGVVLVVVVVRGGRGCGGRVVVWSCGRGVVIRRSKNAPKRHYQLQLWLITKAKAQGQTSNPSPSPIPLDTPALPVNMFMIRSGSKSSSTPVNNSSPSRTRLGWFLLVSPSWASVIIGSTLALLRQKWLTRCSEDPWWLHVQIWHERQQAKLKGTCFTFLEMATHKESRIMKSCLGFKKQAWTIEVAIPLACFHLRGLWVTVSGNFVLQTPQAQQCNGANKVTRSFLWAFFGWKAHRIWVFGRMKSIALTTPRTFVPKLSRLSTKLWNSGTPGWRRLGKRVTNINW